jgi:hypothetical protein
MLAFVASLPGLRAMAAGCAGLLEGCGASALCQALRRPDHVRFVRKLLRGLPAPVWREGELVALDSMAISLPATVRHGLPKMTRTAVGLTMCWAMALSHVRGRRPIQVLAVKRGTAGGAPIVRAAELARGPIWLMDAGFYAIDVVAGWMRRGVRFVVRVNTSRLRYDVVRRLSSPRRLRRGGRARLVCDAVVRLGAPSRRGKRPLVRLIELEHDGRRFVVATSEIDAPATQVLKWYKRRWEIERFHQLVKETLGLAHLYSFGEAGVELHLAVVELIVTLLALSTAGTARGGATVDVLRAALKALRAAAGDYGAWRRNTLRVGQVRHKRKQRKPKYRLADL